MIKYTPPGNSQVVFNSDPEKGCAEGDSAVASSADLLVERLRTDKLSSEIFLKTVAPNYLGVYLVDQRTDQLSSVIAPDYFRAIVRRNNGAYLASMRDYCAEFVAQEDQAALATVLDFEEIHRRVAAGESVDFTYRRRDGLHVRLEVLPFAADRKTTLFWWIFTDEENEHTLVDDLLDACWTLFPEQNGREAHLTWNEGFQRLLEGITDLKQATLRQSMALVHPDDLACVGQLLKNVLESDADPVFDASYRLRLKAGGWRCLRSVGRALRDKQGRIVKVCGFSLDITEQFQLLETQRKLLEGLQREYSSVWLVDGDTQRPSLQRGKFSAKSFLHEPVATTETKTYTESFQDYAARCVVEADRTDFLRDTDWSVVQEKVKTEAVYRVVHRRAMLEGPVYYQVCFALVNSDGKSNDIVVGFQNVNEVVLADQKKSEALAQALQDEEAARRDLAATLAKISEDKRILDALSTDFTAVYYVDLNTGAYKVVRLARNTNVQVFDGCHFATFDDYVDAYCDRFVRPGESLAVREAFRCRNLKAQLLNAPRATFHYRSRTNPRGQQYFEVQAVRVASDDDRFLVLMGMRHIDDIMKKEKAVQSKLQKALRESRLHNEIISAVGKCFQYLARVDLEADFFEELAASDDQYQLSGRNGRFSDFVSERLVPRVAEPYQAALREFSDVKTLPERLKTEEDVVLECQLKDGNWHKTRFIAKKRNAKGVVTHVLFTIRRISNEKRNEESLLYMAETARREAEVKSQFLANMSHDIRTPLNGILGILDMASQHPEDAALQERSRATVRDKVMELTSIVNNVLDLSKFESGSFEEQPIVFDLTDVLRSENSKVEASAGKKGVTYRLDFDMGTLKHTKFLGNPVYLARILHNVAENAVKFSLSGGEIRVWCVERAFDGKTALIEFGCEDHGIGMSEEFAKHAFELFSQEAQTSRTTYSGTGLGLAIVKKLIDRCGGTVDLKTKKNEGTTIVMRLPMRVAAEEAAKAPLHWEDVKVAGRRALVVEDNELNMEIACCLLEASGLEVVQAADGVEAVEKFEASDVGYFDAVFMDIMMPRMNGVEATRAIRALDRPDAAKVPIIAMSANAFSEDVAKSRIAGMNDHLAKPINETMVVDSLKKCLAAAGR